MILVEDFRVVVVFTKLLAQKNLYLLSKRKQKTSMFTSNSFESDEVDYGCIEAYTASLIGTVGKG